MARFRRSSQPINKGDYVAEWWPTRYEGGEYKYNPEKPSYRQYLVKRVTDVVPHTDPWYASRGYSEKVYAIVSSEELLNAELTNKNSSSIVRHEQAKELDHAGYGGPLGGGEARALRRLFTELGKPDLIKHGWLTVSYVATRQPSASQIRRAAWRGSPAPVPYQVDAIKLQHCYAFKSPLEGIHFSKFIRLARMYRDDKKKLRTAVEALLANPEAAKEIEMLDAMELLAGMSGTS